VVGGGFGWVLGRSFWVVSCVWVVAGGGGWVGCGLFGGGWGLLCFCFVGGGVCHGNGVKGWGGFSSGGGGFVLVGELLGCVVCGVCFWGVPGWLWCCCFG